MTDLAQAIAEVKRIATSKTEHMLTPHNEHVATILNAVASGEMVPLADAKLAVAEAYRKAARDADDRYARREMGNPGHHILALADTDALAELQALRDERDRFAARHERHLILGAETRSRAEAAEADLAATQAKLIEWQSLQHYAYIGRDGKTVLARDLEDRLEATQAKLARLSAYGDPEFYVNATAMHERAVDRAKEETEDWKRKAQDANKSKLSDESTIRALRKKLAALEGAKP